MRRSYHNDDGMTAYLKLSHSLSDVDIARLLVVDSFLCQTVTGFLSGTNALVQGHEHSPRSSSYSASREANRLSSSSFLLVVISPSSCFCLRRSTVSRMSDCPSASCLRTWVMSSTVRVETPVSESMVSSFARIWRSCSSFSENVPC